MGNTFHLSRYEDETLLKQLDDHRVKCRTCQLSSVTRVQGACFRAQQIHEQTVRNAQRRAVDRTRTRVPRWESLDLTDLDESTAVEFIRAEQTHRRGLWARIAKRRKVPRRDATLQGIDVSFWQGAFPWGDAAVQGVQLGIAKSSEGVGYTDPQWGVNVAALLAPGPIVGGSYHFARPDLGNSAAGEADWYLGRHPAACFSPTVPWVFSLDAESAGGNAVWVYAFLSAVGARTGYTCWFYSYQNWIADRSVQAYNNPLWIAWPDSGTPPNMGWPAITMQQNGTRAFSVGQVDSDIFLGDRAALYALGGVTTSPVPITGGFLMSLTDQQQSDMYAWLQDVHGGVGNMVSPGGPAIVVDTENRVQQLGTAVAALDAKLTAVLGDDSAVSQKIDTLTTQLSSANSTIQTLSATVLSIQSSSNALQGAVNSLAAALAADNPQATTTALAKVQSTLDALGKHLGEGTP